jgi:hypothetical protein
MVNANPEFSGVLEHFSAKGKPEKARGFRHVICMDKGESNGSGRRCGHVAPKRDTDDLKRYIRRS